MPPKRSGKHVPPKKTYNIDEIHASAETGHNRIGVIPGLGGRQLVKDKTGTVWVFIPVKGKDGYFVKSKITNYASMGEFEAAKQGISTKLREKIIRRWEKLPPINEVEIKLDLTRKEFGKIYAELMNEINARKSIHRAKPFDKNLQENRKKQAEQILTTQDHLVDIHYDSSRKFDTYDLGMTNDAGANIAVRERNGKPVIIVNHKYGGSANYEVKREVGYVVLVIESLLKKFGIKYEKEIVA